MRGRGALAGCLAAAIALVGCGAPKWGGPVSGKVTYGNGRPLPSGAVTFIAADGTAHNAEIEDGKYHLPQAPFGACKVTVMTVPDPPPPGDTGPTADELKKPRGKFVPIPDRYALADKSGLSHTVTDKPTTFDIEIK